MNNRDNNMRNKIKIIMTKQMELIIVKLNISRNLIKMKILYKNK